MNVLRFKIGERWLVLTILRLTDITSAVQFIVVSRSNIVAAHPLDHFDNVSQISKT